MKVDIFAKYSYGGEKYSFNWSCGPYVQMHVQSARECMVTEAQSVKQVHASRRRSA